MEDTKKTSNEILLPSRQRFQASSQWLSTKKEVYQKYGKFNLTLKSAADYELILRMLFKHQIKVEYLPRVIVHMRSGGQSNKSIKNRLKANKEDRMAWEINGLKPYWFTLYLKPIRKITQFIFKN